MGRLIGGLLDNDSTFGRIMTRCGIIIGANLMFVLCCLPVVTIGPGLAALFYVMLKTLRGDGVLNPFREFWHGFRMNFKQGLICFLAFGAVAAVLVLDIRFCIYQGGELTYFKYACYALLIFLGILAIYLMPVMAAFEDTIPHLLRNALFFASRRPLKMLLAAALCAIPAAVTVIDTHMRPLYGFLWTVCGFGLITMMISELLIRDFEEFLPSRDEDLDEENGAEEMSVPKAKTEKEILKEMRRLDE